MLRELHISNLAVISDARIELSPGFNCFTGATGAGKSLVIGAIELLLGLRSPAEMLRAGADEGRVSGLFELADRTLLSTLECAADLHLAGDAGQILLTRRLHSSGRSSVSLNGHPITLSMLKLVAEHLVDVHGQHDHQYLLKPSNQLEVLDQFASLGALREQYHRVYQQLQSAQKRLDDLEAGQILRQQQLELYRFQAEEIDNAGMEPGEYEELTARSAMLSNLEKLKKEVGAVHGALYEAEGSVLERLRMMVGVLGELSQLDTQLKDTARTIRDATILLEESAFDLSRYLDRLDLDPGELAEVHDRLNILNRILSKYGRTPEAVFAHRADLAAKIAAMERATDDLATVESQVAPLTAHLQSLGLDLSHARQAGAAKISPLILSQLAELGMEKARFSVTFAEQPLAAPFGPTGIDQIEFTIQTNPGQPAQPLRRIASGGEMSRIMLALKSILARADQTSVLVFDEIDSNVGGRLGSVIGGKLRELSRRHQVLCITHLPQIAGFAERHLTVRKTVIDDHTETTVRQMNDAERIEELAEMIGGQHITATTRAQAKELLVAANPSASAAPAPLSPRRSPAARQNLKARLRRR